MPQPRGRIGSLVTALAGLVAGVTLAACACTATEHQTLTVSTPADPAMQFRVDSCRADPDACPALCSLALERAGFMGSVDSCDVSFAGTTVTLDVAFEVDDHGFGCPSAPGPAARTGLTVLRAAATHPSTPASRSALVP